MGSVATEQMSPASKQSSVNTANDNGNENLQRVKESSSVDTKTGIISRRSSTSRRDVLMSPKSDAIVECTNVAHNATPSTPTYRQQMLSPAILSSHEQKSGWPGRVEPELVGVVEPQTRLITTNMAPHKDEEAMDLTAKKAKAVATIILQDESPKDSFISAVDNAMDLSMKVSKLPLALTTRKSLEVNSSDADCKDELPREEVPLNFSKPKNILSKRLSSVETADFAPNNDCDIALQKRPKLHSSNSMLPKKWYKDPAIGCQPAVSLAIPRQPPPAHVKMAKNHSLQRGNAESKLGDDQSAHQPLAQGLSSSSTPIPQQHYHTNQHTANLPIHSQPSSAKPLPALFDSIPGNYPVLRGVSVRPPKNTSAQNAQSGMNLSAKPNLQQRWSGGHTKLEKSPNVTVSKLGNVIAPNPSGLLNNQIGKLSSTYSTYSNIAVSQHNQTAGLQQLWLRQANTIHHHQSSDCRQMSHHDSIRMMRAGGQSFSGPPMGQPLPLQHSRQQTDPLPYAHMAMDAARPLLSPPTYPAAGDPRLLSPSMCMMYMGGQDPTKQYPRPPPVS